MKKLIYTILAILLFPACAVTNVYAQECGLERDSLPVFVIQDREFASIVDDFIDTAKKFEDKSPGAFHININLGDNVMSISLHLKEQGEISDSVILYKNQNCHQAFIRHQDILFFAKIKYSAYAYKYNVLAELIKRSSAKQVVYFKNTPSDFFDLSLWGGNPLEGTILSSFHEYDGKKWSHGIFADDN